MTMSNEKIYELINNQRRLFWSTCLMAFFWIAPFFLIQLAFLLSLPPRSWPFPAEIPLVTLPWLCAFITWVASALHTHRVARAIEGSALAWLIASLVPIFNLLSTLTLCRLAAGYLQGKGVKTGLLFPSSVERERVRTLTNQDIL